MSERRKSFFAKDNEPDSSMLQYLNTVQQRTKRNSITKLGNSPNKTSTLQASRDTTKQNTTQFNQDIDLISEKLTKSIFLKNDIDLNQFLTSSSINNPRKSINLGPLMPTEANSQLPLVITQRNNSKRGTTQTNAPPAVPAQPKRQYKDSQDLFCQTQNYKAKHKSEITNQLLLNTQIRMLHKHQEKKKAADLIPFFTNTTSLNKYIINQYHIGNDQCSLYSRRKQKVAESTFNTIRQKKINEIKKQNKTALMLTLANTKHSYPIDSNDNSFTCCEDDVRDLKKLYYDTREKERVSKGNDFLKKLEDLSTNRYELLDANNPINHKNLSRVIQVMKLKEKMSKTSINQQKRKLQEDEAKVILATSKLGPPLYTKARLKKDTQAKFLGINGSYFGYPV